MFKGNQQKNSTQIRLADKESKENKTNMLIWGWAPSYLGNGKGCNSVAIYTTDKSTYN